jgi:hypothetical protein
MKVFKILVVDYICIDKHLQLKTVIMGDDFSVLVQGVNVNKSSIKFTGIEICNTAQDDTRQCLMVSM